MKAKITKTEGWRIFIKGETLHFPQGVILEGPLAEKAIDARCASKILPPKTKKKSLNAAPENK